MCGQGVDISSRSGPHPRGSAGQISNLARRPPLIQPASQWENAGKFRNSAMTAFRRSVEFRPFPCRFRTNSVVIWGPSPLGEMLVKIPIWPSASAVRLSISMGECWSNFPFDLGRPAVSTTFPRGNAGQIFHSDPIPRGGRLNAAHSMEIPRAIWSRNAGRVDHPPMTAEVRN